MIHGLDADHVIDGISLRNIRINGKKVTSKNVSDFFDVNQFVKNLSVSE